ncbi:protein-disulfide reductase DsbD N-terminal domain-containing protein [Mucilaginibacter sp. BJC16-A38]|uniref:protein-disulfide reductase DsbD N-terminal domain-containing protein n=1 Tax=Mucilaginibacter phenanthrenivorans TaxID=1234842 RepID=UPI00215733CA|nr:protein-disulfide reductase DsbD N-terminal domain-containing protein [Mucilaginibacter phenanthrenivorans]MCR8560822.1 protein-disulfide reductase DsbD N-terminal domain-containing protein [Mucilaginibacter phenanthrenivorans]MDP9077018.1 protein-disulfide reductase DsbD N-terminal domain-containing protein [Bacteroidota bacterium]
MKKVFLAVIALVLSVGAKAQIESHVKWSYAAKKISATEAVVFLKATIDDKWHIYGLDVKDGGPIKTSFTFAPSKDYSLIGKPVQPTPVTKYEPNFKMDVTYFEKSVIFQQKIKLKSANATAVKGQLEFMTCNDQKCLPPEDIDFSIPLGK